MAQTLPVIMDNRGDRGVLHASARGPKRGTGEAGLVRDTKEMALCRVFLTTFRNGSCQP
jgi:hypothetical protein